MCGIAGIWRYDGRCVNSNELKKMAEAITHRGPDDEGGLLINSKEAGSIKDMLKSNKASQVYDIGMVNRRLAIVDLTQNGHQPMVFEGCVLVFNGEIYNYLEIAQELKSLGHLFESRCDTEILLHAYTQWGKDCLRKLNGIYAFAIWDARKKRLFCARDRLGVKPFYYFSDDHEIIFCSEMKGILAATKDRFSINEALVFDYLTSGRLDHVDETFFERIVRLPAGCYLEITRKKMRIERYWDVTKVANSYKSLDSHVRKFSEIFRSAIDYQMRSDVDVASCLSGGMDSSAIVSVAAPKSNYRMRTYTARFRDPTMDEWEYARSVHKIKPVEPIAVYAEPNDFWNSLSQLVWDQEEPFGGPGVFAQWNLMRRIRKDNIKVVLDGQGGDELLCGYAKYFYFSIREMLRRKEFIPAGKAILDSIYRRGNHLFNFVAARRYLPGEWWLDQHCKSLLNCDLLKKFSEREIKHPAFDVREQQQLDILRYSIPPLLRYEDKNSMAHSIESRVPFLDHRLVELAVSLPTSHKIMGSQSKYIMKKALAGDMPKKVLERRGKLGYGGTYQSWVNELSPRIEDWLRKPNRAVDRFVRPAALKILLRKRDPIIFKPLILDSWLERFGSI